MEGGCYPIKEEFGRFGHGYLVLLNGQASTKLLDGTSYDMIPFIGLSHGLFSGSDYLLTVGIQIPAQENVAYLAHEYFIGPIDTHAPSLVLSDVVLIQNSSFACPESCFF